MPGNIAIFKPNINIAENPAAYLAKLLAEGWTPGGDK
jgi:hypothetical protein